MTPEPTPLVVNVADLLHRPGARRHEDLRARLEGISVVGTRVAAGDEVSVAVTLEPVSEGILVSGSVSAPWHGECRRCLTALSGAVRADVRELYEPHAREGETYPLRHDQVDLEPLAREALLLELPLAPLCRDDCLGICPTCGADLNEGPCGCAPADRDPRWAALDDLRLGE
jgi:uncharacterized protein